MKQELITLKSSTATLKLAPQGVSQGLAYYTDPDADNVARAAKLTVQNPIGRNASGYVSHTIKLVLPEFRTTPGCTTESTVLCGVDVRVWTGKNSTRAFRALLRIYPSIAPECADSINHRQSREYRLMTDFISVVMEHGENFSVLIAFLAHMLIRK